MGMFYRFLAIKGSFGSIFLVFDNFEENFFSAYVLFFQKFYLHGHLIWGYFSEFCELRRFWGVIFEIQNFLKNFLICCPI